MLIARIKEGKSVALVSDAGTPLISDPGYHLVTRCREAGVKVVPLPGPCAAITALSAAGLPTDRFAFEGFLPAKARGGMIACKPSSKTPALWCSTNRRAGCRIPWKRLLASLASARWWCAAS